MRKGARLGQADPLVFVAFAGVLLVILVPLTTISVIMAGKSNGLHESLISVDASPSAGSKIGDVEVMAVEEAPGLLNLSVRNLSPSPLAVEKVILVLRSEEGTTLSEERGFNVASGSSLTLLLDGYNRHCATPCSPASVVLVTDDGERIVASVYTRNLIHELEKTRKVRLAATVISINPPSSADVSLREALSLGAVEFDPTLLAEPRQGSSFDGMVIVEVKGNAKAKGYLLNVSYANVSITIDRAPATSLYVGHHIEDGRFNLLVSKHAGENGGPQGLRVNGNSVPFPCPPAKGYRLKVIGFVPSTKQIITLNNAPVMSIPEDPAAYALLPSGSRVSLSGRAAALYIYCEEEPGKVYSTSYDPYVLLVRTRLDARGYMLLFTSVDGGYGNNAMANDGTLDYSTRPLMLVFKRPAINNTEYSRVILTLRLRYYDNELDYESGLRDEAKTRPILRFGLVDENGKTIALRSLTIRDLSGYKVTTPPSTVPAIFSLIVDLPNPALAGGRAYKVFVELQDPFDGLKERDRVLNDVDLLILVEEVSLVLFRR